MDTMSNEDGFIVCVAVQECECKTKAVLLKRNLIVNQNLTLTVISRINDGFSLNRD